MTKHLSKPKINPFDTAYADKVYKFLQNGKPGASYTLDVICEKENQPVFIEWVKEFMRITKMAGGWEFNSDYSKLRRVDLEFTSIKIKNGN